MTAYSNDVKQAVSLNMFIILYALPHISNRSIRSAWHSHSFGRGALLWIGSVTCQAWTSQLVFLGRCYQSWRTVFAWSSVYVIGIVRGSSAVEDSSVQRPRYLNPYDESEAGTFQLSTDKVSASRSHAGRNSAASRPSLVSSQTI